MAGVNKVILLGHLGKDPEVRHLENGRAVANFSLATSETYKNRDGERITNTEWHNIVLWTPLAELAEKFLKKGSQLYLEGKITSRSYEDKENNTKYITEIVGREMNFIGTGKKEGQPNQNTTLNDTYSAAEAESTSEVDDLPF